MGELTRKVEELGKRRDLDDFRAAYPEAQWLEDMAGCERWTNGLGEGSLDESAWFCKDCQEEVTSPYEPDCGCTEDVEEADGEISERTNMGEILGSWARV